MTNDGAIEQAQRVREMFDRIVPRYDLVNRVMTGGRDVAWRNMVAKQVAAVEPRCGVVLDVATGTGDLAFAIQRAGAARVIGVDFSPEMIQAAKSKNRGDAVEFLEADGMNLPFADGSFDACTISFGLRNMRDYQAAIREMTRVLRPGGVWVCLEMTPMGTPVLSSLFRLYFERVVPVLGGVLSGDLQAYRYLPQSVRGFPDARRLLDLMRSAGLVDARYKSLGFGAVAIHSGVKV